MKNARKWVLPGALTIGAFLAGGASADDKTDKPTDTPLVRAEVRVDASGRPNFSGTWKLNEDLSEDPCKKMQEAGGARGGHGGGMVRGGGEGSGGFGGRRGMGGGGGRRGGGDAGESSSDRATRLSESLAAQKVLTISHKDPQLVITDLNGRARTFFTDARKVEEEHSEGTAKIQTKWKDRSIVVVTKLGDREITDTYERAADGARLFLTTKMEGGRAPFSFRRVYEAPLTPMPAEGGAADPKSEPKPPST